ncbi:MAG: APC family permease [Acidaminococcus sp.]|jgi:amino acid transporter|nr:APC family permease [Acidaminococcus sp.]MCI2100543.1 APC family permease [Acidaminococcus sp.]MCI2114864.1 APC family permease [Acidaminococcus sp.]MCI2117555.1 APC family permease [Acidaminococcus sp.]
MAGDKKDKFGLVSIVLLGINSIVGTGIFLLPNRAYALMGPSSLVVLLFDAFLAGCLALCFAETAGFFSRNGGPYLYAKAAFGDFWGYEVGVLKMFVSVIAWAAMAVGFATALGAAIPFFQGDTMKNIIATVMIGGLTILNIAGVKVSKILNNVMTVSKLVPLFVFIAIGIFFINGDNFTPFVPEHMADGAVANAAITMFFAYTGFEAIAIGAEDYKDPKKNLPRGIILTMVIVTILYMLVVGISIGILGPDLATDKAPIQSAFGRILGPVGMYFILAGTLCSMGGINMAESFYAPRGCTSLAEDGMLPEVLNKRTPWGTPWVASVVIAVLSILLAWSGSFTTLAAISAVSRFTQYLPTCLAVIVFRKKWKDRERTYKIPGGIIIPVIAILTSLWMLSNAKTTQLIWGLGGCIIIAPYYLVYANKKKKGLIKESKDE